MIFFSVSPIQALLELTNPVLISQLKPDKGVTVCLRVMSLGKHVHLNSRVTIRAMKGLHYTL